MKITLQDLDTVVLLDVVRELRLSIVSELQAGRAVSRQRFDHGKGVTMLQPGSKRIWIAAAQATGDTDIEWDDAFDVMVALALGY